MQGRPKKGARHDRNKDPLSLAQFLGASGAHVVHRAAQQVRRATPALSPGPLLHGLLNTLRRLDECPLILVLAEVVATKRDLRARVNPKYRFDERMHDLTQCLLLDGYIVEDTKLVQVDPSIADADAASLEDDLIVARQNSRAPRAHAIPSANEQGNTIQTSATG